MANRNLYVDGGTVQAQSGAVYLYRKADKDLLDLCRDSNFAYVLTARQMGKSSLMVQAAKKLTEENIHSVKIDLTQLGKRLTHEAWYLGILFEIKRQIGLRVNVMKWWQEQDSKGLGTTQRLVLFLEEGLLAETEQPVVIFIDEIETTRKLKFTDDFFAAIRSLYNLRALKPIFQRLTFVLIGVATPNSLIQDQQLTPFNIGTGVVLTDFTFDEAFPLVEGWEMEDVDARRLLQLVLQWTGGHPYLTQRLCRTIAETKKKDWSEEELGLLVNRIFQGEGSFQDSNLRFVQEMLLTDEHDRAEVLATYRQILHGKRVTDEEQSLVKSHLKLSGVVYDQDNLLCIRNPIYRQVFNEGWIKEHFPINWTKRLTRVAAGLVLTLMALSIPTSVWAYVAQRSAKAAQSAAVAERDVAQQQRRIADEARAEAMEQRDKANEQRSLAEVSRLVATQQATKAEKQSEIAENARHAAEIAVERETAARKAADLAAINETKQRLVAEDLATKLRTTIVSEKAAKQEALLARDTTDSRALGLTASLLFQYAPSQMASIVQLARASLQKSMTQSEPILSNATAYQVLTKGLASLLRNRALPNITSEKFAQGISISPKATYAAAVDKDGTVRLFDIAGNRSIEIAASGDRLTGPVWYDSIAFTQDERFMVIRFAKGARVWETATGGEVGSLVDYGGEVVTVALSPSGHFLAMAGTDSKARIWDLDTRKQIAEMTHQFLGRGRSVPRKIERLIFSNDETHLISASNDDSIKLWDLKTAGLLRSVEHESLINHILTLSPSGKYIATAGLTSDVRLWDTNTLQLLSTIRQDAVVNLKFSPDEQLLVTTEFTTGEITPAEVWQVSTGAKVRTITPDNGALGIKFDPIGKYLVTTGSADGARIWEVSTGIEVGRMIDKLIPSYTTFSASGDKLVTVSDSVRVSDMPGGWGDIKFRLKPNADEIVFSRTGKYLAAIGHNVINVRETSSGREVASLAYNSSSGPSGITGFAFSPDEQLVAISGYRGAKVIDIVNAREVGKMPYEKVGLVGRIPRNKFDICFGPDSKYVITNSNGLMQRWEITGKLVNSVPFHSGKTLYSPDGQYMAVNDSDNRAQILQTADGREVARFPQAKIRFMTFSEDGTRFATANEEGADVYETQNGRFLAHKNFRSGPGFVYLSADGSSFATVENQTVRIFATATGRETRTIGSAELKVDSTNLSFNVDYATFSRDWKYVAIRSSPSVISAIDTLSVWDTATGKKLINQTFESRLGSVTFSLDNKYLAYTLPDKERSPEDFIELRLWHPQDLIDETCLRVTQPLKQSDFQTIIGDGTIDVCQISK